jgi:hypothetical protein
MNDRFQDAFARAVRNVFPSISHHGMYEYRVHRASPPAYDLAPTDPNIGLPPLSDVKATPGIPGLSSEMVVGALVYVRFINSNPARPVIVAVAGPGDDGFTPSSISLEASGTITVGGSTDVHVGGFEAANPATAAGRFVRYGDTIVGPSSVGVPIVITPTGVGTMSKAGT